MALASIGCRRSPASDRSKDKTRARPRDPDMILLNRIGSGASSFTDLLMINCKAAHGKHAFATHGYLVGARGDRDHESDIQFVRLQL